MKTPKQRHMGMLKRVARFLRRYPRLIQKFPAQGHVGRLDVWVDSNYAGCVRTRKSIMGGVIILGKATIKTYCKGQAVIA